MQPGANRKKETKTRADARAHHALRLLLGHQVWRHKRRGADKSEQEAHANAPLPRRPCPSLRALPLAPDGGGARFGCFHVGCDAGRGRRCQRLVVCVGVMCVWVLMCAGASVWISVGDVCTFWAHVECGRGCESSLTSVSLRRARLRLDEKNSYKNRKSPRDTTSTIYIVYLFSIYDLF